MHNELVQSYEFIVHRKRSTNYQLQAKRTNNQLGQTLIELVIVIAVLVLIIGALVSATIASLRNAQFSNNLTQATKLAQEGIEKVRSSRDRNKTISFGTITSWNGSSSSLCSGTADVLADSLWCYHISGSSGSCDSPNQSPDKGLCYFNIDSSSGVLTNIGSNVTTGIPSVAESDQSTPPLPKGFRRVITMSDDLDHNNVFDDAYKYQKEVTVIVTWSDFAGAHESRLTTILRKL